LNQSGSIATEFQLWMRWHMTASPILPNRFTMRFLVDSKLCVCGTPLTEHGFQLSWTYWTHQFRKAESSPLSRQENSHSVLV
jgi:hypothetical protein